MRERLPELMHGVLRADVAAEVRAHVAQCADCRAELEMLERVRTVLTPPRVDTARITASLPRYRKASSPWARALRSTELRAAAAILLMVGGYFAVRDTTADVAAPDTTVAVATTTSGVPELAIGDTFQDLTDADLSAMLDEIAKLEPVTPDATDDDVPSLSERPARGGGGGA